MLYQLSYEATHWERGQFIELLYYLFEFYTVITKNRWSPLCDATADEEVIELNTKKI